MAGAIPKTAPFGAEALSGGRVRVAMRGRTMDVDIVLVGSMVAALLHAAHHATRMLPAEPASPLGATVAPPVRVWAIGLAPANTPDVHLRLAFGATDFGLLLESGQSARLGQALIAASAPAGSRPQ